MWLLNIVELVKTAPLKLLIIASIITSLIGFIVYYDKSRFNAGYNKAKAEYLEELKVAQMHSEANLEALSVQLKEVKATSNINKKKATELQGILDSRPVVEIIREIESVSTMGCDDLGDDFSWVLKSIVGEAPKID